MRTILITFLISLLLLCLLPSAAGAAISAYQNSEAATFLGKVTKANCKVKRTGSGKIFHAKGRTTNGAYTLEIDIYDFTNFSRSYNVPYGVINPTVDFEGAVDYSNNYPFPGGQPPGSGGAIEFARDGSKLGLGVYGLPNPDYSMGVALAGGMKCNYPRPRR